MGIRTLIALGLLAVAGSAIAADGPMPWAFVNGSAKGYLIKLRRHLGAGRLAAIVRVENFASPVSVDAGKYVLVIASENPTVALGIKTARAWVDAGASHICAWGPDSEEVHQPNRANQGEDDHPRSTYRAI